jgi:antirestriction protein ArdC
MAKFSKKSAAAVAPAFSLVEELWSCMTQGTAPWQQTWKEGNAPGKPMNFTTGKHYRSGNALWLMAIAARNGMSNCWISFNEVRKAGGNLAGEKSSRIEVPFITTEVDKKTGEEKEVLKGFRSCSVFNIDQVKDVVLTREGVKTPIGSCDAVEAMLAHLKAQGLTVNESSIDEGCFYDPLKDEISMPARSTFEDTYAYYSALAHEMAHATGRPGRVERPEISYVFEEMRAEIASTLICNTLQLPRSQKHIDNHAAFLKDYIQEFADQKSMLLKAASEAQAIHDYLMNTCDELATA